MYVSDGQGRLHIKKGSRFSQISIAVSIVLHVIAFSVFAFVRFYDSEDVQAAKVAVSFVDVENTRVLKRSAYVRPLSSVEQSPQHRPEVQQMDTRVDFRSSSDFNFTSTPKVFSEVKSVGRGSMQSTDIKRPSMNFRAGVANPMATDIRSSVNKSAQTQAGVTGGSDLFGGASMQLAKPEIDLSTDSESALKNFLNSVRRKIESKKTYPASARDSGIEGNTEVKLTILKNGQLANVEVVNSSGNEILDNAALQSVRNAAPFPVIPKLVERDSITMSIQLVFKIEQS
jgi:TonB family protein